MDEIVEDEKEKLKDLNRPNLRRQAQEKHQQILHLLKQPNLTEVLNWEEENSKEEVITENNNTEITPPNWERAGSGLSHLMYKREVEEFAVPIDSTMCSVFHIGQELGQEHDNDIILPHKNTHYSREHALLFHDEEGNCFIMDRCSRDSSSSSSSFQHGTFVDGCKVGREPYLVQIGSRITFFSCDTDTTTYARLVGEDNQEHEEDIQNLTPTQSTQSTTKTGEGNPTTLAGLDELTDPEKYCGIAAVKYICSQLVAERKFWKTPTPIQVYLLQWMSHPLIQDIPNRFTTEDKRQQTEILEKELERKFFTNSWEIQDKKNYYRVLWNALSIAIQVHRKDLPGEQFELGNEINYFHGKGSETNDFQIFKIFFVTHKLFKVVMGVPSGQPNTVRRQGQRQGRRQWSQGRDNESVEPQNSKVSRFSAASDAPTSARGTAPTSVDSETATSNHSSVSGHLFQNQGHSSRKSCDHHHCKKKTSYMCMQPTCQTITTSHKKINGTQRVGIWYCQDHQHIHLNNAQNGEGV